MKKNLKKAMGCFGIGMALFATTMNASASVCGSYGCSTAISDEEFNVSTTVGSVDEPVYSVSLSWESMQYNYKYVAESDSYVWAPADTCTLLEKNDENTTLLSLVEEHRSKYGYNRVYTDATCNTIYDGEDTEEDLASQPVFLGVKAGGLSISDSSINGSVIPSLSWAPSTGYEMVKANVTYTINEEGAGDGNLTLDTKQELPSSARTYVGDSMDENGNIISTYVYSLNLELTNDLSKGEPTPKSGDTIGTLTVSLKAAE